MKKSKQSKSDKRALKINKTKIQRAPVAIAEVQKFPSKLGRRSWRFRGSELISSIRGKVLFTATRFEINPGIAHTFPWLSGEAEKWEHYRFHYLNFRYVPRCATTTPGSVLISPDYNVRDAAPVTEQQAADTYGAVESTPWSSFSCPLDPSAMFPFGPRKLLRSARVAGDMNLYDSGNLYVSVLGALNDDESWGKLWVDYEVEFFVPQNSPEDLFAATMTTVLQRVTPQSGILPGFSTTLGLGGFLQNPFGATLGSNSTTLGLPAGVYCVTCSGVIVDVLNGAFGISVGYYLPSRGYVSRCVDVNTSASAGFNTMASFNFSEVVTFEEGDHIEVRIIPTSMTNNPLTCTNQGQPLYMLITPA